MYTGPLVFTQVMDFMPLKTFQRCVERYHGNFSVKNFTCLRPVARSISIYNCNNFSGVMQSNIFIRHNNPQNINGKGKSKISF